MTSAKGATRRGVADEDRPAIALHVTAAAAASLRTALAEKGAGWAVRVFVGGGAHPQAGMTLDRPTPRDEQLTVAGLPFVVDTGSRPFLEDATIDFVQSGGGGGFQVTGPNAPGGGTPAPAAGDGPPTSDFETAARSVLKKVFDPEIPMNIVDLGLIYGLERDREGHVTVRLTMTSPGCPVADLLCDEVRRAVAQVPGVKGVQVDVVWDPPWGPDKMSEFARRQLGLA